MTATELEERAQTNPWGLIAEALLHQAKGEPVPDDLQDAITLAAVILTALALREAGMADAVLEELFDERDFTVKLAYSGDSGEMSCSIEWDQGEACTVKGRLASGDDA